MKDTILLLITFSILVFFSVTGVLFASIYDTDKALRSLEKRVLVVETKLNLQKGVYS